MAVNTVTAESKLCLKLGASVVKGAFLFGTVAAISLIGTALLKTALAAGPVATGAITSVGLAFSSLGFSISQYLFDKKIISLNTKKIIEMTSFGVGIVATVALAIFLSAGPANGALLAALGVVISARILGIA